MIHFEQVREKTELRWWCAEQNTTVHSGIEVDAEKCIGHVLAIQAPTLAEANQRLVAITGYAHIHRLSSTNFEERWGFFNELDGKETPTLYGFTLVDYLETSTNTALVVFKHYHDGSVVKIRKGD